MNKERVLMVADAIENEKIPGLAFDMGVWFYSTGSVTSKIMMERALEEGRPACGTAGCIAGWAAHLALDLKKPGSSNFAYNMDELDWFNPHNFKMDYAAGSWYLEFGAEIIASAYLELTVEEMNELFKIQSFQDAYDNFNLRVVTKKMAGQALRNLVEFGDPKWAGILPTEGLIPTVPEGEEDDSWYEDEEPVE